MKLPRIATLGLAVAAALLVVPSAAVAAPPDSSAVSVSPTSIDRGATFTVTQEVYNPRDFTIVGARPTLIGIGDVAEIVSCDGSLLPCNDFLGGFRSYVGDLVPDAGRTVTWTLRIKDDAPLGDVRLKHSLDGENFGFPTLDGPLLTITSPDADLGVTITATPRGVLTSRIEYSITVRNDGPADATDIRLVATYAAGLQFAGSTSCARVGTTRMVGCDLAALAAGTSRTVKFAARAGLLTIGSLTTTVQREQSTPTDPEAANDHASMTCAALTGLLVRC
ncbi:MAG TPA: DUF11 domain-containing protein [Nocardioidaceae bacterium]|nr:DUF11 domain-containing protein [Nocardioidaceae bacterium]